MMTRFQNPTYAEIYNLGQKGDFASLLKAASIKASETGDKEFADTLSLMSAQMDFSDNTTDSGAVEQTRQKLDQLIRERQNRVNMTYNTLMSDDEIIAKIGAQRQVTQPEAKPMWNVVFNRHGLYDPRIFGGAATPLILTDDNPCLYQTYNYGQNMGYIQMPTCVFDIRFFHEASGLLKISIKNLKKIVYYACYVATNDQDDDYKTVYTEKELRPLLDQGKTGLMTGAKAIQKLLNDLNLPDHPEHMVFTVLPVIAPCLRPIAFDPKTKKWIIESIFQHYSKVMFRCRRLDKLLSINAPEIILNNEQRMLQEYVDALLHDGYTYADGEKDPSVIQELTERYSHKDPDNEITNISRTQTTMLMRLRFSGYNVIDQEENDPVPVDFYPKTVTVQEGSSTVKIPYSEVMQTNMDIVNQLESDYRISHQDEDEPDEPNEEYQKIEQLYEQNDLLADELCDNPAIVLKQDPKTVLYVKANE